VDFGLGLAYQPLVEQTKKEWLARMTKTLLHNMATASQFHLMMAQKVSESKQVYTPLH